MRLPAGWMGEIAIACLTQFLPPPVFNLWNSPTNIMCIIPARTDITVNINDQKLARLPGNCFNFSGRNEGRRSKDMQNWKLYRHAREKYNLIKNFAGYNKGDRRHPTDCANFSVCNSHRSRWKLLTSLADVWVQFCFAAIASCSCGVKVSSQDES